MGAVVGEAGGGDVEASEDLGGGFVEAEDNLDMAIGVLGDDCDGVAGANCAKGGLVGMKKENGEGAYVVSQRRLFLMVDSMTAIFLMASSGESMP